MNRHLLLLFCLLSLLGNLRGTGSETLSGGVFELRGHVSGGGGTSAGGQFHLFGGISETATGTSSNSNFKVTGGWIQHLTMPLPPGDIFLDIAFAPSGLEISWPPEALGSQLESTPLLGPSAQWQVIPGTEQQTSIVLQPDDRTRFFRMRLR